MTDDATGLPTDQLEADGTRARADVDDEHRRVHVERGRRRAARDHRPPRADAAAGADARRTLERMERHAPRRPVLQLVRPHGPARSSRSGRRAASRSRRSSPPSTTPGSPSGCGSCATRCRSSPRARARSTTAWTSASTTEPARQPDPLPHTRPDTGCGAVLLRHDRLGEPDRVLRRDREGRPAVERLLRPVAHVPRHLRLVVARRRGRPASPAATRAAACSRAATRTATTRLVPSWGGSMFEALMPPLFVPEERWGPGSWAANHPHTVDAQIDHGLNVAGYGAWGFSPSNNTVGRLHASSASTRSGWTRTATRRTSTARSSTAASHRTARAGRRARPAAERVHERHRHAARGVPRPALAPARGARLARGAGGRSARGRRSGFYDAVNVDTGEAAVGAYLSLDQGMIMAALGNALGA